MHAAMQLATPHSTKRKARILVVDDDPGLLRLLTIRLRAENYEVEAVESAALALAATSRFRPELVITDLRMDQMDGIGLLKELQSRYPGLKVIILTAHGTIPDAVHATQLGAHCAARRSRIGRCTAAAARLSAIEIHHIRS